MSINNLYTEGKKSWQNINVNTLNCATLTANDDTLIRGRVLIDNLEANPVFVDNCDFSVRSLENVMILYGTSLYNEYRRYIAYALDEKTEMTPGQIIRTLANNASNNVNHLFRVGVTNLQTPPVLTGVVDCFRIGLTNTSTWSSLRSMVSGVLFVSSQTT